MYLSIIIPAYNEERNLKRGVLEDIWDYLTKQKYSREVWLVDDGSEDETLQMVENFTKGHQGFHLLRESHRGKATAILAGMEKARGEVVLFCDLDQSTPVSEIEKFLPKLKEGYEVVIGWRKTRHKTPWTRRMVSGAYMVLKRLFLNLPYHDTQCGFKAFRREVWEKILPEFEMYRGISHIRHAELISASSARLEIPKRVRDDRRETKGSLPNAGFDLELLYLAKRMGLKVAEVEVEWTHRESEVSSLRIAWLGARDVLKIWWKVAK